MILCRLLNRCWNTWIGIGIIWLSALRRVVEIWLSIRIRKGLLQSWILVNNFLEFIEELVNDWWKIVEYLVGLWHNIAEDFADTFAWMLPYRSCLDSDSDLLRQPVMHFHFPWMMMTMTMAIQSSKYCSFPHCVGHCLPWCLIHLHGWHGAHSSAGIATGRRVTVEGITRARIYPHGHGHVHELLLTRISPGGGLLARLSHRTAVGAGVRWASEIFQGSRSCGSGLIDDGLVRSWVGLRQGLSIAVIAVPFRHFLRRVGWGLHLSFCCEILSISSRGLPVTWGTTNGIYSGKNKIFLNFLNIIFYSHWL